MKTIKTISLLIVLGALTFVACKKEAKENNTTVPTITNCLVKSVSGSNNIVFDYVYDDLNKLLSVTTKNGSSESTTGYSYLGKTVKIGTNEIFYLNTSGFVESSDHNLPNGEMHITYQYNNQNQLISTNGNGIQNGTSNSISSTYEYANGNRIKMTNESSTSIFPVVTYEYFLDKVNPFKKSTESKTFKNDNANLVKAQFNDGILAISYTYEFDEKGNVIKKTTTNASGDVTVENYTWDCPN